MKQVIQEMKGIVATTIKEAIETPVYKAGKRAKVRATVPHEESVRVYANKLIEQLTQVSNELGQWVKAESDPHVKRFLQMATMNIDKIKGAFVTVSHKAVPLKPSAAVAAAVTKDKRPIEVLKR